MAATSKRSPEQSGAGVLGTFVGAVVFLVLLLFAVHVVLGLYVTSVVTAVAYDAAKTVAAGEPAAPVTTRARASLGPIGARTSFEWSGEGDEVVLRVRAPRPVVLPPSLLGGWADIERTVRMRVETVR